MLHGFHILLEVGNPCLRLEHRVTHGTRRLIEVAIKLFVVNQRSRRSLTPVDLGADRVQVRRRPSSVLDGLLAAIQNATRLLEQV